MAEKPNQKLGSWKEIADFLGRDVRTVRRWETERGLPVHRGPEGKGSSVYAYAEELEAWLKGRSHWGEAAPDHVTDAPTRVVPPSPENQPTLYAASGFPAGSRLSRALLLAAAIAVVAVAGYFARQIYLPVARPQAGRIMLAVLPFSNLSGDASQEYFSDGLTEEMITQLSRVNPQRLAVIARTSSMAYKHTSERIDQIGHELGVDYVLECSVRRAGNHARITVQLIKASDQTHVWAEDYDRQVKEILALESDVAQIVARRIGVELRAQAQPLPASARPANPEAYEAYLEGRFYWNKRNTLALKKSVEYFRQAIAQDPNYALAYAGLADSYILLGFADLSPAAVMFKAKVAATKALELDDTLAEAHTSLAGVNTVFDWDWVGAERGFKRAMELDPGYAPAHHWYAILYCAALGKNEEAIDQMKQAQKLDPVSPVISTDLGWAYFIAGQSDRAIEQYNRALELDPNFIQASDRLSQAYIRKGMYAEAIRLLRPNQPNDVTRAMQQGLQEGGYRGALRAELRILTQHLNAEGYQPAYTLGLIYAGLDEKDQAVAWLEKAYQQHYPAVIYLKTDPQFSNLRPDPRFQELLRRIGLTS